MSDLSVFKRRLAETARWCALHVSVADPSGSLRSSALRPDIDDSKTYLCYRWSTISEQLAAVTKLSERRAQLLRVEKHYPDVADELWTNGRLMLYYPNANLFDGVALQESKGYFDVDNAPPWDTWLYYVHDDVMWTEPREKQDEAYASYVISWVPPDFVAVAGRGIYVNPEQCISWVDDVDTAFIRQLRDRGLLTSGPLR